MKAVFMLIALFAFGLFVNVMSMTFEDDDMSEDEFNRGFSMADGIDESNFEKMTHPHVDDDMVDDEQNRMADPLRVRIRVRRPYYAPTTIGLAGYAGLGGGYAGSGGFGLAGRFGLNFDDVDDSNIDAQDEEGSSDTADDEEPEIPTLSDDDIQRLADRIIRISIKTRRRFPYPRYNRYGLGRFRRPFGLPAEAEDISPVTDGEDSENLRSAQGDLARDDISMDDQMPGVIKSPRLQMKSRVSPIMTSRRMSLALIRARMARLRGLFNVRGRWMCRCPLCGRLYECPGYVSHLQKLH